MCGTEVVRHVSAEDARDDRRAKLMQRRGGVQIYTMYECYEDTQGPISPMLCKGWRDGPGRAPPASGRMLHRCPGTRAADRKQHRVFVVLCLFAVCVCVGVSPSHCTWKVLAQCMCSRTLWSLYSVARSDLGRGKRWECVCVWACVHEWVSACVACVGRLQGVGVGWLEGWVG